MKKLFVETYGMNKKPQVYIIAGPNGSGKTTFATEFLPNYADCPTFVNADTIARGLSGFSPDAVALKAGRILLEQVEAYAAKRIDFSFETTLSGTGYLSRLRDLKKEGYLIHLFFLWIPDVRLALARIASRVKMGGHDIAERKSGKTRVSDQKLYDNVLRLMEEK